MSKKPSIPKGTRDFSPTEVVKRTYIMDTIKRSFTQFGFQPIETPSFENSDTLMGKYGEEGDRLIFKILNSGRFIKDSHELIRFGNRLFKILRKEFFIEFFEDFLNKGEDFTKKKNGDIEETTLSDKDLKSIDNYLDAYIKGKRFSVKAEPLSSVDQKNIQSILKSEFRILADYTYIILYLMRFEGANHIHWLTNHNRLRNDLINSFFSKNLTPKISEKALRYDLTVPFARYVVQHQNDITFPFKRYQIQPVWRADRPQKGRFREFFQCDADVVGSKSLWQEVELVQLYDTVFTALGLKGTTIKMNNRKILSGIAEVIGAQDKLIDFTVALDKLDKIGEEGVKKEMREKGITEDAIQKVQPLFSFTGTAIEKLASLETMLASSGTGQKGIEELRFIVSNISALGLQSANLEIDVTLARGLNYYTGAIFEVAAPEGVAMGSIGGGGRYDDLTGIFGMKDVSGVGISFGLDRIYLVIEELGLFPETVSANTKVLFINFGEKEGLYAMQAITKLRVNGIAAELYPDKTKMGKQMGYADKRDITFTVLAGDKEMETGNYTLKNMKTGTQEVLDFDGLVNSLK